MSPESDLLSQLNKYGDIVVAFVVVQSLAFGYTLGREDSLTLAIVYGRQKISPIILWAALGYAVLVAICGILEFALRSAEKQSRLVLSITTAVIFARILIVATASGLSYYGLQVQPPYSDMAAKLHAQTGHATD